MSAAYKSRWAAWFWISFAMHLGVTVEELGELGLKSVERRIRS